MSSLLNRRARGAPAAAPPAAPKRDPAWRDWMIAYEAAPDAYRWTAELVGGRLKSAMRVVGWVTPSVLPRAEGRGSPDYIKDELERWFERMAAEQDRKKDAAERNRSKRVASREDILQMEEAIWWPGRYLPAEGPHGATARAFQLWLACCGLRQSFTEACQEVGLSRDTAKDRCERARLIIARGLVLDRVATLIDPDSFDRRDYRAPGPPLVAPALDAAPGWWIEVEVLGTTYGLGDALACIRQRVREEYHGRRLSPAVEAEMRARIAIFGERARAEFPEREASS